MPNRREPERATINIDPECSTLLGFTKSPAKPSANLPCGDCEEPLTAED
jgi:hypothetical protein